MQSSILADILLPIAIVLTMVAIGMTLTKDDFADLWLQKRAVLIGLFCQLMVLPFIGFAISWAFALAPVFAISMVLLAVCPGGSTSNLMVHLSNADRVLSVTLTTFSNVMVFVTMPLYLSVAQRWFGSIDGEPSIPTTDLGIQIAALTVVPIGLGMFLRAKAPQVAITTESAGKTIATAVLAIVTFGLVVENWSTIVEEVPTFGPAFITLNISALAAGWFFARCARLSELEAATISLETGTQNVTIAIAVSLTIFNSQEMAVVPGLYGLWSLVTGLLTALTLQRLRERKQADGPTSILPSSIL